MDLFDLFPYLWIGWSFLLDQTNKYMIFWQKLTSIWLNDGSIMFYRYGQFSMGWVRERTNIPVHIITWIEIDPSCHRKMIKVLIHSCRFMRLRIFFIISWSEYTSLSLFVHSSFQHALVRLYMVEDYQVQNLLIYQTISN